MKKTVLKLIISAVLVLVAVIFFRQFAATQLVTFIASYIIIGYKTVFKSLRNILRGNVFDENFLMTTASVGAFIIGEHLEGVAVMMFYQIGELFQEQAVNKSRKSISSLMEICPDTATVLRDGVYQTIDSEEIQIGETILIKPGERVALDCVVVSGETTVDSSAITGEPMPRHVLCGDEILSGFINESNVITARVTKEFSESTASKILELVENASSRKSKSESFITRFARYYTPFVVFSALAIALIPPLLSSSFSFSKQIYIALSFLVASCPCALVISVPLSFFGGLGAAASRGILIKGSNYLESLAQTRVAIFDKTGTLTHGVFNVQEVVSSSVSKEQLLELAAFCEHFSEHPIAKSIKKACPQKIDESRILSYEEIAGHGVCASISGTKYYAGNARLMKKAGFDAPAPAVAGTIVHLCSEDEYLGYISIADEIKADSKNAISELKRAGVAKTIMLTGDNSENALYVASEVGIDDVYSELLPNEKLQRAEEIIGKMSKHGKVVFIGDGINDTPVLSRADIGIAMGALGQDAAIDAADVVLMADEPSKLLVAMRLSRYTLRIVKQNIVFSLAVKGLILILCALSVASMWAAVFADVGVSVLAILNAIRILRKKNF